MEYFNLLPVEIQFDILKDTDPIDLIRLCQTSSQYQSICSDQYDYLWRMLLFGLIKPSRDYEAVAEFNDVNKTTFRNWYDAYIIFYKISRKYTGLYNFAKNCNLEHYIKLLYTNGILKSFAR